MGRGKGKRGGRGRGGGGRRMFITNAEELELNNRRQEAMERLRAERRIAAGAMSDDDDESGSGSEMEEGEGADDAGGFVFERGAAEGSEDEGSEEDAKPKKASGAQAVIDIQNPNKDPTRRHDRGIKLKDLKNMNLGDEDADAKPKATLTRREREEQEKQAAKEAYMKRHRAGETEEAKKDMERLAIIKKRREEAAKKREVEAKEAEERQKKLEEEAQAANEAASGKVAKLDSREIKKMNPTLLKEHLKALGLPIQGSKKDLMSRLIEAHKNL
mmetsp:Transcript_10881/g.14171  ORF Transcript_10881/g.14171 Transcript_10881/m.14171 type:complete len:273 (+) Transcript_10881:247-1065(+)|eukprot:CAMPEP_0117756796 /NCGR_PEP_ID=MMETSP0947-20121206/14316_1 /TAXON_ID=44440 /ORGANISM="Chattonella subsalsa, Strain CCMP2191" /LENGTH=272 /DNA_ID=CAMNT_0005576501 /DNA_START=142 /DNA_END=960 /DNA_ORIENTATION=+